MKLAPDFAETVAFAELLNVPTTGRTERKIFWELFDESYASRLEAVLTDGRRRLVVLSGAVIRTMRDVSRRVGVFPWLPDPKGFGLIHEIGETQFVKFKHLSSAISNDELGEMGSKIIEFCDLGEDSL